jgi:sugar/nucleoside kinase (ribokinase family)
MERRDSRSSQRSLRDRSEQVADAARRLASAGLVVGTAGNVSARSDDQIAITPTGAHLDELNADQVTVVDLEGATVAGELEPTSERDLHLGVYRRYGAGAVVHTHAPMATALASHLHLGGPEFMGGEAAARILSFARERGTVTSADILAPGEQAAGIRDWIAPALEHLDYLLPNDEQVLALSGEDELIAACRALIARGVGCVAATQGPQGAAIVDPDGVERVPAFAVEVIDTTGCGDSFSAGFLRGLALGRSRRDSAVLGCAAAALVAQGLGSDYGRFDLETADEFAVRTPVIGGAPPEA